MKTRLMGNYEFKNKEKTNGRYCFFFALKFTMSYKHRFHSLGPIVLPVSVIYKFGVFCEQLTKLRFNRQ